MISLNSSSAFYHAAQILKPSQGLGKELFVTPCRTPYLQWPQHHWLHWLVSQLPPPCRCHWCGVTGKTVVSRWEGFQKVWRLEHFVGKPKISRYFKDWNMLKVQLTTHFAETLSSREDDLQSILEAKSRSRCITWDLWNFTTLGPVEGMRDRYG